MANNPEKHHRRSIRLRGYDYSRAGAYFVTICAQDRACLFGEVVDGKMQLNDAGRVVVDAWSWLNVQYPHIQLDEWVVMPHHLHGIIIISDGRGGSHVRAVREPPLRVRESMGVANRPNTRTAPTGKCKPIGRLIGAFKTVSTKRINNMRGTPGISVWQRNYYEHIIRNDDSLNRIREYIVNNPLQWAMDRENPVGAVRM